MKEKNRGLNHGCPAICKRLCIFVHPVHERHVPERQPNAPETLKPISVAHSDHVTQRIGEKGHNKKKRITEPELAGPFRLARCAFLVFMFSKWILFTCLSCSCFVLSSLTPAVLSILDSPAAQKQPCWILRRS